jgi:hypothetical protein
MISFVMVFGLALTTLYLGVYVAESLDRMEMRRCPQSDTGVRRADQ